MFEEGAVLYLTQKGRESLEFPDTYKRARVVEKSGSTYKLETLDGKHFYIGHVNFEKCFYNPRDVNKEVIKILESGINIQSFSAITTEGKKIQVEVSDLQ